MSKIQHSTFNGEHPWMAKASRIWAPGFDRSILNVPRLVLIFIIRIYRWTISPAQVFLFGPACGCRFTPTCSQYAMDAVREHGALVGAALSFWRICRCKPWGGCGHDPVPDRRMAIKIENSD